MRTSLASIEETVQIYLDGVHDADAEKLARAFHDSALLMSVHDGKLSAVGRDAFITAFASRASPRSRGLARHDWIMSIDQSGPNTAFAKVQCAIPPSFFTDYLTLARVAAEWRIVSKTFHTEQR